MPRPLCARAAVLLVAAVFFEARPACAQRYDVSYLEFPYGFLSSSIGGISDEGHVVGAGIYRHRIEYVPVLWREGELTGLPLLRQEAYGQASQYSRGLAWGINEPGDIVGQSDTPTIGQKAVLWPAGGGVIDLIDRDSIAFDINDSRVIVGSYLVGGFSTNAFRWENGNWSSLYPPMEVAEAINNHGQIVGYGGSGSFVWDSGVFTTLPSLGGNDRVRDINDAGQMVGSSGVEGLPVIWENGTIRQLPHFGVGAWGLSINEGGDIVGKYFYRDGPIMRMRPCIWRNNFMMILNDLADLPLKGDGELVGDPCINDAGQIATVALSYEWETAYPVRLEPVDIGLALWGIDPSRPGRRNTIEIHHVSPNGRVILLWGTTRGEGQPFEQCSGAMIDLADPHLAAVGVADANGVARITLNVPANVEGNYIFQAVDHTTCEVSPPAWALFKMVN